MAFTVRFNSFRCPGCTTSRRSGLRARAGPDDAPQDDKEEKAKLQRPKGVRRGPVELPKTGYFGMADPRAPVYKNFAGMGSGDVTKRGGGKWESDFIWNTRWQERMDAEADTAESQRKRERGEVDTKQEGNLSFAKLDLNDMNVDLSAQLNKPSRVSKDPATPAVKRRPRKKNGGYAAKPPSAVEQRRWVRSAGYIARGAAAAPPPERRDPEMIEQIETDQQEYEEMKQRYSLWTTATVLAATAYVYTFFSRDITASYVAGALGGIVYLRLLNKSVDSFAAGQVSGGDAGGNTRLLIPVILVLFFNRFNVLYSDQYDIHLELFPMLMGFFTYKASALGAGAVGLYQELSGAAFAERNGAFKGGSEDMDASSVDRAFTKRMLTK